MSVCLSDSCLYVCLFVSCCVRLLMLISGTCMYTIMLLEVLEIKISAMKSPKMKK